MFIIKEMGGLIIAIWHDSIIKRRYNRWFTQAAPRELLRPCKALIIDSKSFSICVSLEAYDFQK